MAQTMLIHHAANRRHGRPAGSESAVRACLDAAARVVEIDITPLADGAFVLLHDERLEDATDGQGIVAQVTAEQARGIHYRQGGTVTDEPIGFLDQVIPLITAAPDLVELQLDLKEHSLLTDKALADLLRLLQPVKERVRITSGADWAIRRLRGLDPGLPLGFDPLLYVEIGCGEEETDPTQPPFRVGAYGYADDHPLASRVWGASADYLAARAEALWAQAPVEMWYIRAALLARALDDGFDWIAYLHARGAAVAAWTLDPDQPHHVHLARLLLERGVDRITTNDAPRLAAMLGGGVVF